MKYKSRIIRYLEISSRVIRSVVDVRTFRRERSECGRTILSKTLVVAGLELEAHRRVQDRLVDRRRVVLVDGVDVLSVWRRRRPIRRRRLRVRSSDPHVEASVDVSVHRMTLLSRIEV